MKTEEPQVLKLSEYQPPQFDVVNLQLTFELSAERTLVTNRFEYRNGGSSEMHLEGLNLDLLSLKLDGEDWSQYKKTDSELIIESVPSGGILEIQTQVHPAKNGSLEGLYKSGPYLVTQNEAQGFRRITYFFDRPDVMTSYEVILRGDKLLYPVLLANGDRISSQDLPDGRHEVVWKDPYKKPCYLFALVAGDFGLLKDQFVTRSGRSVALEIYCIKGKEGLCHHAMESLKKAMKWDEDRFNLEYDLDTYMIVAIDDFNAGAMENKGLNVFNSRLIFANEDLATDDDYDSIESVVGHEYFHNWTGNRITLRDWFQLSLKEGLTVFRDQEFSSDMGSRSLVRVRDIATLKSKQYPEDAGPSAHPTRPETCLSVDNFFSATIYEKGSEIIRMMQTLLGKEGFEKGLAEYISTNDGKAATLEDFFSAFEKANEVSLENFLNWYKQPGTPKVVISTSFSDGMFTVTFTQTKAEVPHWKEKLRYLPIPIKWSLLDKEGQFLEFSVPGAKKAKEGSYLTLLEGQSVTLKVPASEKPVLSAFHELSAPVNVEYDQPSEERAFLLNHDRDGFVRYEAAQRLHKEGHEALFRGESLSDLYKESMSQLVAKGFEDPHFTAYLISSPSQKDLWQTGESFAPDKDLRCFLSRYRHLSEALGDRVFETIEKIQACLKKESDTGRIYGLRAFLGEMIKLYGFQEGSDTYLQERVRQSPTMTERLSALRSLSLAYPSLFSEVCGEFYEKYRSEGLALLQLYRLIGAHPHKEGFGLINEFMEKPEFSIKTPNHVYSLIRVFNDHNVMTFHDNWKTTYPFTMDLIGKIDSFNPQVAARVTQGFQLINDLDGARKASLKDLSQSLIQSQKLSKNTFEYLSKL